MRTSILEDLDAYPRTSRRSRATPSTAKSRYKVGPLFAADPEIAADLLSALLATVTPGSLVFLDPPLPNAAAGELVSRLGWRPIFETARMYRGDPLQLPVDELFGVTTFELG
ncbi:hypothetical protein [Microbacterium sp. NPDC076895]|uniref:hypothetical protein n=1 Tax=Microbacterium sp. NPDC076895 TaxID=3154957 RepID=UPI00342468A3